MELVRVFNNNVVLALDDAGREVILTGRGLGFQARPGQPIDPSRVVRTFRPIDGRDPDHLAELMAAIPPADISVVVAGLAEAGLDKLAENPALVVALADHIGFAARRVAVGMDLEYPLLAEVTHLYPQEYEQALALLAAINARLDAELPAIEAVGLALHLVNAGFSTGDLSFTYRMTGVIQQVIAVIERAFGVELPDDSVSVGRFITHLRYLFVRVQQHKQLDEAVHSVIGVAIRDASPSGYDCAKRVAAVLELRLGAPLTQDEVCYLALHIARLTTAP